MNAMNDMPAPLVFSDTAASKVKALIEEEGNPDLKLRVFVTGGGCSGFQYGFTFDEVTNEDDTAMVKDGVTLLIDPMSYQYLVGAEIDYTEGLEGAQFVIKNPNAQIDLRLRIELLALRRRSGDLYKRDPGGPVLFLCAACQAAVQPPSIDKSAPVIDAALRRRDRPPSPPLRRFRQSAWSAARPAARRVRRPPR